MEIPTAFPECYSTHMHYQSLISMVTGSSRVAPNDRKWHLSSFGLRLVKQSNTHGRCCKQFSWQDLHFGQQLEQQFADRMGMAIFMGVSEF